MDLRLPARNPGIFGVKSEDVPGPAPLVSILLPVYNAEHTLLEALQSLRQQTLENWECIVIDDASTDRSAEIAEQVAASDLRFFVHRKPAREGIIRALNLAARLARAPLLARQDADDLSHPDRLAECLALLRGRSRLGAVACRVRLFPQENLLPGWLAYGEWLNGLVTPEDIAREIYVESPLPHPSVMMRREAFDECGGYHDHGWPEDYDLWLRMHAAGWLFAKPPGVLYDWRHSEGRLTHQDPRYAAEAFLACKLHHLATRLAKATLLIWGAGREGGRLAHALEASGLSVEAFIDIDPRKIGGHRQGCPVLSPQRLGIRRHWPASDHPPLVLVAVGTKGARPLIRTRLETMGWHERDDFICLH